MAASKISQRQSRANGKQASAALGRLFGGDDSDRVGSNGLSAADRQNRCKSVLARPGVPALFLVVCFVIIANTSCDPVGGATAAYHPSLRYGRRSAADVAEPASAHTELGKLTFNNLGSFKSFLQSRPDGSHNNNNRAGAIIYEQQQLGNADTGSSLDESNLANFQSEIGKLLKCNYIGVSNLYWCDTGASKWSANETK